jgi:hypothetical protein
MEIKSAQLFRRKRGANPHTHTYIHTYVHACLQTAFQKPSGRIRAGEGGGGRNRVILSKSRDQFLSEHNTFSFILCTWESG